MADQVQCVPAPPAPAQAGQQTQQQKWQQDDLAPPVHAPSAQQPGWQVVHLNWYYFGQNFQGNLMMMQKHICFTPMIG